MSDKCNLKKRKNIIVQYNIQTLYRDKSGVTNISQDLIETPQKYNKNTGVC